MNRQSMLKTGIAILLCFALLPGTGSASSGCKEKVQRSKPALVRFSGNVPRPEKIDYWVLARSSCNQRVAKYKSFNATFLPAGSYKILLKPMGEAERLLQEVTIEPGQSQVVSLR